MKNIGIYGIQFNAKKQSIFEDLFSYFRNQKTNYSIKVHAAFKEMLSPHVNTVNEFDSFNHEDNLNQFDLIICMGGDGAILDTFCLVEDTGVPVLGINTGSLGFLSGISDEKIEKPLSEVLLGKYEIDPRKSLKLSTSGKFTGTFNYALNEIVVQKKDSSSMMTIHAYVDGLYLNSYWADGLIVSTPTGSTGYNLSCSGPIIMPGSDVFVVTPIAPHNLNVRPLVIPNNKKLTLKLEGRDDEFLVALDSRSQPIKSVEELSVERGEFEMKIVRPLDHSFLSTLRNKLTWGLDSRN